MGKDIQRYEDILQLPHHQSPTRKPMSNTERAAQFMPFRALTGYGDCIRESARTTDCRAELDESEQTVIGEKLYILQMALAKIPRGAIPGVCIRFFVQDANKDGGSYCTLTGAVKRVDSVAQLVCMQDDTRIPMENIVSITGGFFRENQIESE